MKKRGGKAVDKWEKDAEIKHVICTVSDNYCTLKAAIVDGVLQGLAPYEDTKALF